MTLTHDVRDAVAGAYAVYTDVWVSMGQDDEREQRLARFGDYQVNQERMNEACDAAVFMHCLPAHRGLEVSSEVIDGPSSLVFAQAANRLATEQASPACADPPATVIVPGGGGGQRPRPTFRGR